MPTFDVNDDGVFVYEKAENGMPERSRICSRLDAVAQTRDSQSDDWGLLLRWKDPDDHEHEWAMPKKLLASRKEIVQYLLDRGLSVEHRKQGALLEYLSSQEPEDRYRCVHQIGWHGSTFVFPNFSNTDADGERIVFQSPDASADIYRTSGDIDEWKQNVGARCSGNSRLVFVVSCAFAGPVLKLLEIESGGAHLYATTTTGKTTAGVIGGSVWGGGGKDGFVQSWRTTANGLELTAALHNDACLFLDEIGQLDPKQAAEVPYLLANGHGKSRMTSEITARPTASWRLQYVSTGELTLEQQAGASCVTKGGMEVRLLNIPADAGKSMGVFENLHGAATAGQFAQQLRDAALRFYGTPSRLWVNWLSSNCDFAKFMLMEYMARFEKEHAPRNASSEVRRSVRRFAVIAAAGELATFLEITGWQEGEASRGCARCLLAWLDARGGSIEFDATRYVQRVRLFLEVNGHSRFQPLQGDSSIPNRAGFRRKDGGDRTQYLILSEVFRLDICQGLDYKQVCAALIKSGHLETDQGRLTKQERLPEMDRARVYAVRDTIFNDDLGCHQSPVSSPGNGDV